MCTEYQTFRHPQSNTRRKACFNIGAFLLKSQSVQLAHFILLVNLATFDMFGEFCARLHFGLICEEED